MLCLWSLILFVLRITIHVLIINILALIVPVMYHYLIFPLYPAHPTPMFHHMYSEHGNSYLILYFFVYCIVSRSGQEPAFVQLSVSHFTILVLVPSVSVSVLLSTKPVSVEALRC